MQSGGGQNGTPEWPRPRCRQEAQEEMQAAPQSLSGEVSWHFKEWSPE